jgi:hypothetical protein
MKLSPEEEVKGLRAYEQVRAFEALRRRRLPMVYVVFTSLWLVGSLIGWRMNPSLLTGSLVACAVFIGALFWMQWQYLRARYAHNLTILHEMEATYGELLPWIQVERHLQELDKIRQEERESRGE